MTHRRPIALAALSLLALCAGAAWGQASSEVRARIDGAAEVTWRSPVSATRPVDVRILGLNDLHGQLEARQRAQGTDTTRPVGGAAVLAAFLAEERAAAPGRTLTLIAGDSIGASALESGLLHDEPTLEVLDQLVDGDCPRLTRAWADREAPAVTRCRILATVGNHEFDHGTAELERLLYGGRRADEPGAKAWPGQRIPYLAANLRRREGGRPWLPAAAIVELAGVRIGIVGAVTAETPALVMADQVRDVEFLPEAAAINAAVAGLQEHGVHTIVLVIHEGLQAPTTPEPAPLAPAELHGRLAAVLAALDGGVDVVVAGHTHKAQNVLVPLRDGRLALVTQARAYGTAYSAIELTLDAASGAVVAKSARILTTWGDDGAGQKPDRRVARIVERASKATAAIKDRPIGSAAAAIRRGEPSDPESALGNLVADAERAAAATDLAITNAGGIRNDIEAGAITYGTLYNVHPFGNRLVRVTLTGAQLLRLLEQQWSGGNEAAPRFLRIAGLRYVYDLALPPGQRVVAADDARGEAIDPARAYRVVVNDFILRGGDHYTVLAEGTDPAPLMTDLEALENYVRAAAGPVKAALDGRARPFAARATPPAASAR
ncbi:MAG: 5'-nucleotidase C-terminal domain-containing protein [Proteobacteria bacterium]|nr:5'-nucleotidase C-terminal domain-containing protein [Pseudomonadota bacterium]